MPGQRIGYIRVSSFDQNPERQLDQVDVSRLFTDRASGKDARRPQLEQLLAFAREGDTVVVHSMDRLARNLDDLRRIVQSLSNNGIRVEFVKEHLTFSGDDSPMAQLMLSVMGAFAEFERALTPTVEVTVPVAPATFTAHACRLPRLAAPSNTRSAIYQRGQACFVSLQTE